MRINRIAAMALLVANVVAVGVSAKDTIVTVWTAQDLDVRYGKSHHEILWGPFEKANPGIKVQWSRPGDYENKLLTAYASDSGPDIFAVDGINVPAWANRGMLEALDKYIPNDVKQDYWKTCLEEMTWKGKLYALGFETNSHVAFYNPGLLAKAGLPGPAKHLEDLEMQARKLSMDANGDGTFEQYCAETWLGGTGEGSMWYDTALIWQFGGDIIDSNDKALFTQKAAMDAAQWLQDACYKYKIFTSRKNLKMQSGGFEGQKLVYNWTGPFNYGPFEKSCKFKWEVAHTPYPADGKRVSGTGGWHFAMNHASKKKVATAKVMQYISSKDFVRTLADSYGMPVRSSIVREMDARNKYPWSVAIEQMAFGKARPRHPKYRYITAAVTGALNDIVWKESPVKARLDAAQREMETALRK